MFSVPGKRTKRSLARTKHARSEIFFPHSVKKKKSDQCWYLVVFGSRSVLLSVLLIKSLPSKHISHIRLDRNKIKKKNQKKQDQCVLKRTKKERRRGRRLNEWQSKETYHGEGRAERRDGRRERSFVQRESKEMRRGAWGFRHVRTDEFLWVFS